MNQSKRFMHSLGLLALMLVVSIVLMGCSGMQPVGVTKETVTSSPVPSDTPAPTSTFTPIPTATPTLTATATRTATPNRTATRAVVQTATQSAIDEMVDAELVKYGIDPALGHVAWVMESPYELDGGGYATGWFRKIVELGVLKDFVVQTEVTWDTSGGLAGCGYIFRAPDDWDVKIGDFYSVSIMRLQYAPVWMIDYFKDGRWQYTLPGQEGVTSSNIEDEKMSKNVLALDARGPMLTVYLNGIKERTIENGKVTEGRLAFEVVQNSGTSYCKFENGWVWEYDE